MKAKWIVIPFVVCFIVSIPFGVNLGIAYATYEQNIERIKFEEKCLRDSFLADKLILESIDKRFRPKPFDK